MLYYETLTTCLHPNFDDYFMVCEDCGWEPELESNCCGAAIQGTAADVAAHNHSLTNCPACGEHCEAVVIAK